MRYKCVYSAAYLGTGLKIERQYVFTAPRLALPHQKHAVAVETLLQHQLSGLHSRKRTVKPRILVQTMIGSGSAKRRRPTAASSSVTAGNTRIAGQYSYISYNAVRGERS